MLRMKNKPDAHAGTSKVDAEVEIPRRVVVTYLCYFIIVGHFVGAIVFGPFLVRESRKLPLIECLFVWWSDLTTLIATAILFVRHSWLGVPLEDVQGTQRRAGWLKNMVLLGIVGSVYADAWVSWRLASSESEAFAAAVRTEGTIDSVEVVRREKNPWHSLYSLRCSFLVGEDLHHSQFFVGNPNDLHKLRNASAIQNNQLPVSVAIAYDPENPRRCWLADVGCKFQLYYHSIFIMGLQVLASMMFLSHLINDRDAHGFLPWWHVLFGPVLLATQAGAMLIFGVVNLFTEMPLWR